MKNIFIALVIAAIFISLLGFYDKKQYQANKKVTRTINLKVERHHTPTNEANKSMPKKTIAFDGLPDEPSVKQEPTQQSANVIEETLQDITTDEKAVILGEVVHNLREICTAAIDTQKALLSVDLNKDIKSVTELESKKEKDNGIR